MLDIRLFAVPQLELDGSSLHLSGKGWLLLAYLLLHRPPTPRLLLAATLWPDVDEATARTNLRRSLHSLRVALPAATVQPWVLSVADSLQWNLAADYTCDVTQFEQLSHDPATYAAAVALYRGDLAAGIYDDWVIFQREQLHNLYLRDLEGLIRVSRQSRDYAAATSYAQQLLAAEPLHEAALRQLLAVRYEAGDRAEVLAEYARFAALLRRELAANPMPETVTLYEAIRHNQPLPGTGVREATAVTVTSRHFSLPLLGRDAELAQLQAAWQQATLGQGSVVFLSGEAGGGKSRLAATISQQAEADGARILYGQTSPSEPLPYQAVVATLRQAIPLLASSRIEPLQLRALLPLLPELASRLGLSPLPALDPQSECGRLYRAVRACVQALAEPRPLLLILEDLHWAGPESVALLRELVRDAGEQRLLVVVTYRDEEVSRSHPLRELRAELQQSGQAHAIALSRLDQRAIEQLIGWLPELAEHGERLHQQSEGNPFILQELVSNRLTGADDPLATPGAHNLIGERVARLGPNSRLAAEVAAVVGASFNLELLREVAGWDEAQAQGAVGELLDRRLVQESGTGGYDYSFSHHLIQEAIYRSLPEDVRRRRHRRTGQVLTEMHPARPDRAAELARHFDEGGEPVQAVSYYREAAEEALKVYADDAALHALGRALALDEDARVEFALLALRESIYQRHGSRERQQADLARLQEITVWLDDADLHCEVLTRLISFNDAIGNRMMQAALCAALDQQAAASPNCRWAIKAAQLRANYELAVSHYDAAQTAAHHGLQLARQSDVLKAAIEFHCQLAQCALGQSDYAEANHALAEARLLIKEDDKLTLLKVIKVAYDVALAQMDYPTKHQLAREMLATSLALHDSSGEALAYSRLGMVAIDQQLPEQAFNYFQQAEELCTSIGDLSTLALMLNNKSLLLMRLGRHPEADALIERAITIHQSLNNAAGQVKAAINLIYSYNVQGRFAQSCQVGEWALILARQIGSPQHEADLLVNVAAAKRELGDAAAVEYHRMVVALKRQLEVHGSELRTAIVKLAHMELEHGNLAEAQRQVEAALNLQLAEQYPFSFWHTTNWTAARVARALGDAVASRSHLA